MFPQLPSRLTSIDKLRGLVMIIMALDHVRDFVHVSAQTADPLNLETTTPSLFFTRWITHFCAPVFVFLSGTSAWLFARNRSRQESSAFLMKRGLWLVIADITLVNVALTFNPLFNFVLLTVIWAIGWSMILLGLLMRFSPRLILPIGVILFLTHDLITTMSLGNDAGSAVLKVLFQGLFIVPVDAGHMIGFLYAILPWTALMLLGYYFGRYVNNRSVILKTGIAVTVLFVVLRLINVYGDPSRWVHDGLTVKSFLSYINTSKYPPSLQFACMTLGPALVLLSMFSVAPTADNKSILLTYGRVPFFYYVVHLFVGHLILVALFFISGHGVHEIIDPASPFLFRPKIFGFNLWVVYANWILVVALLYQPCRWFYRYKRTHVAWWFKYT